MRELFFDTETTGKADFKKSSTDPVQPHLVQLGAVLRDNGTEVASVSLLVQPPIPIPADAGAIHGITDDLVKRVGMSLSNTAYLFRDMVTCADVVVAHNITFDRLVMKKALFEADIPEIPWDQLKTRCTMTTSTNILKLPGMRGYKWPKLEECMQYFYGESIAGAHDALVDVRACVRVYDALMNLNAFG